MVIVNTRGNGRPGIALLSLWVGTVFAGSILSAQSYTGRLGVEAPGGVYVDLVKEGYRWNKPNGSGDWTKVTSADVDASGWPVTDARWIYDGRPVAEWIGTLDDPDAYRIDYSGVYKGSFTGQAALTNLQGPFTLANQSYNPATNTTTFDLMMSPPGPNHGLIVLSFTDTKRNPGGATGTGIANFRLIRPGYGGDSTQVFTDAFFHALNSANFSTIRFMGVSAINGNVEFDANGPILQSWANRKQVTDAAQTSIEPLNKKDGWAYENMIDVCNRANMDLWLNVPVAVDDDYIAQLARLVKARLNGNLNVYLEHGNEMWNFGFPQYAWNKAKAVQEVKAGGSNFTYDGSTNQEVWAQRRHAKRVRDLVTIFGSVFGSDSINTRIRGVLAGVTSNANGFFIVGRLPGLLSYLKDNYGDPSGYIYTISEPVYYGGKAAQGDSSTASDTVEQILADMKASIDGQTTERQSMVLLANNYHLPGGFSAYEGGPDTGGGSTTNLANRIRAVRDPGQADLYKRNFATTFWDLGGNLAMQFTLASPYQRYGTYGLTDDIKNPDRNSLFRAVRDLIGTGGSTVRPRLDRNRHLRLPVGIEP